MTDKDLTAPEAVPQRLTRPHPQSVANGYSTEPDIDEVWEALNDAYAQIDALRAGLTEAEAEDGHLRRVESAAAYVISWYDADNEHSCNDLGEAITELRAALQEKPHAG